MRGSYRLPDVLEYIEWILDRSRMSASSHGPAGASSLPAIMDRDVPEIGLQPRDRADGSVDDEGREPCAAPSKTGRRVLYLLDWLAPHLDPAVDDLIHSAGHAVVRIGGHLTGLVQVEDTHAHASYSAKYKREETQAAWEQLMIRPDRLPSTSRQTVMDRAMSAWSHVDHAMASMGARMQWHGERPGRQRGW